MLLFMLASTCTSPLTTSATGKTAWRCSTRLLSCVYCESVLFLCYFYFKNKFVLNCKKMCELWKCEWEKSRWKGSKMAFDAAGFRCVLLGFFFLVLSFLYPPSGIWTTKCLCLWPMEKWLSIKEKQVTWKCGAMGTLFFVFISFYLFFSCCCAIAHLTAEQNLLLLIL